MYATKKNKIGKKQIHMHIYVDERNKMEFRLKFHYVKQ